LRNSARRKARFLPCTCLGCWPDYCIDRVQTLKRDYGMDEFICYFNQGGVMDHAMVRDSMTRFAKEVMPHCR